MLFKPLTVTLDTTVVVFAGFALKNSEMVLFEFSFLTYQNRTQKKITKKKNVGKIIFFSKIKNQKINLQPLSQVLQLF